MKKFVFALIMAILLSTNAQAETSNFVSDYEKELAKCLENYKQQQKQCFFCAPMLYNINHGNPHYVKERFSNLFLIKYSYTPPPHRSTDTSWSIR